MGEIEVVDIVDKSMKFCNFGKEKNDWGRDCSPIIQLIPVINIIGNKNDILNSRWCINT